MVLDDSRNAAAVGTEARSSADGTTVHAYVIPVDEESIIARATDDLLSGTQGTGV